ncbi:MAG: phosphatidate cytidylyltransferase [candidate division NC10 bacterium]|nr:phosphatidate cytidylyltransferase [candidate division NC10 bacterium]MBI3003063.1 phosphatidate cytidylyltransferase [candidate division NC10 bacterium]
MHLKRILTAAVLLPAVLLLTWFGSPLVFAAILAAVAGRVAWEFYGLLGARFGPLPRPLGVLLAAAVAAAPGLPAGAEGTLLLLALAVMATAVSLLLRPGSLEPGLGVLAATLLPVLYAGGLLGFAAALRVLPGGREHVLYLMTVTWVADTAAFYAGSALGRTPLAPRVSPRKTVEGGLAALAAGGCASVLFQRAVGGTVPWWGALLLGLLLVAAGQVGDLAESLCKRSAGVKDAGGLLPGHGALLDRLDSLLFAAPVLYLLVRLRWL